MIFAQTQLTTPLPSATSPGGGSISSGAWWLLPIAIGLVFGVWFFRRKSRSSEQHGSAKQVTAERTRTKSSPSIVKDGPSDRVTISKKKKKKKNRSSSGAAEKTVVESPQIAIQSKKRVTSQSETSFDQPISQPSEPAKPRSTPVKAIFEPIRDAGALRRVSNPEKPSNPSKANPKSGVNVTRQAGVKFERTINHTATTQSISNRWGDIKPAAQQSRAQQPSVQQSVVASATSPARSMETSTVASTLSTTTLPGSMIGEPPTPSQGLKSFVSKVRAVAAKESEPTSPEIISTSKSDS